MEARDAAEQAYQQYESAKQAREGKAQLEEKRRAAAATQHRKEYAAECEQRTREWSDLRAQWQSSRGAIMSAQTSRAQIFWTFVEIVALLLTIGVGVWAIIASQLSAGASITLASDQLKGARDEAAAQWQRFVAERRPWLKADISLTGPLTITEEHLMLPVMVTVTNIGHSPAVYAGICILMFCETEDGPPLATALQKTRDDMREGGEFGMTVFPQSHFSEKLTLTLRREKLGDMPVVFMYLIGAVQYRFAIDGEPHQTPISYHVVWKGTEDAVPRIEEMPSGIGLMDAHDDMAHPFPLETGVIAIDRITVTQELESPGPD